MFCFTNDRTCSYAALLLCLLGIVCAQPVSAASTEDRYLDVWSQGYSRFEITDGDVVAFFTEGVEFTYLGAHAQANSLRYNHATQVAAATGDVILTMDEGELAAQEMIFDGVSGQISLTGGIAGLHRTSGFSFTAEQATAQFSAGEPLAELGQLNVELTGGITLTSADGDMLRTAEFHYDGSSGVFNSKDEFVITFAADRWKNKAGASPDLSGLMLTGEQLKGSFDEDRGIQELVAEGIDISARELSATATSVQTESVEYDRDLGALTAAQLKINELAGRILKPDGDEINLAANNGYLTIDTEGIASIELAGGVDVDYAGTPFATESLLLLRSSDGFSMALVEDVVLEFDLAGIGGYEPIPREQVESLLKR